MKRVVAAVLSAALLTGCLAGCGDKSKGSDADVNVKLSVWPPEMAQNFPSGQQTDPVMKKIEEKFNVTMDIDTHPTDEKFNVLLASNSLPDIVQTQAKYVQRIIESDTAIPLDEYMEKLGTDITTNAPKAVEFSKENFSNGTNKLYFLPTQVGEQSGASAIVGQFVRWDYYKELGYPEINSDDDWLNVVEQMQKLHPTNEDGEKVYGFSPWFDWDLWPYYMGGAFLTSYTYMLDGMLQIDRKTDEISSMIYDKENSLLWQGTKFWFKANQKGLLDPDALTQKYDTAIQKGSTNKVLSSQAVWQTRDSNQVLKSAGYEDRGYASMPIPRKNQEYAVSNKEAGDANRMWFVNKSCKDPERAMQILNYLYSREGANMIINGIEGVDFTVENGKRKVTQEFLDTQKNNPEWVGVTGATKYQNWCGLGTYYDWDKENDEKLIISDRETSIANMTPMDKDFCERYGIELPGDYPEEKGVLVDDNTGMVTALLPETSTDVKRTDDKILSYLQSNLPKMILASSEEEFNTLQDQIINEIKGMGYDEVFQYHTTNYKEALAKVKASE